MTEYGPYRNLSVEIDDGVAALTLERPDSYNALDTATMLDLRRAFDALSLDHDIAVVTIAGAGSAFSAGADLGEYAGPTADHEETQIRRQELFRDLYRTVFEFHAPVVAKIHGYCVGAGLILAMHCDLRVAAESAEFAIPTVDIGQIPGGGSTRRAVELLGETAARELVYTADYVDAERALAMGLLNDVVPEAALDEAIANRVDSIRSGGHRAVKASKRALNDSVDAPDPESAAAREAEHWWAQFATAERERLVAAFHEDD
ncbi:enoyl-CoA hydratase/isomerase family protein [Halorarius litoreus]|uniref:enoyl-CoA hydratase/isomerase family protein n=1 Tax=Halorarius litoreus TaxID=2962676 RepID=UPI0020CE2AA3|nr:enoyl-CoA hydratase/isomerase family protein [Halorarius litoreus]